jgi:hypothetical protein
MEIHLTEQDIFAVRHEIQHGNLTDEEACVLAVRKFHDREHPGRSLRGNAITLLDYLFASRRRADRLERYILRKAKEHNFEVEASDVLYGDRL